MQLQRTASRLLLLGMGALLLAIGACGDDTRTTAERAAMEQERMREQILAVFPDPARAAQIQGLFEEWRKNLEERQLAHAAYLRRLDALNADYEATPEAFRALYQERFALELQSRQQALSFRDRLQAATTPEEWKSLTDIRADLRKGQQP